MKAKIMLAGLVLVLGTAFAATAMAFDGGDPIPLCRPDVPCTIIK
jgi:hypothetical protein